MELFLLYIWLKLGAITKMIYISAAILAALFFVVMARVAIYNDNISSYDKDQTRKKYNETPWKRLIIPSIFCAVFAGLIPTKTDVAVLVAGHYALKLSDTPEAGKLMTVIRKKANDILDAELVEQK